jgi:PhnB protein
MQLNPYLNFDGQCAEAFRFYEQLLGGKIETMLTRGESPVAGEVPAAWHDRILHARLTVGDQVLMGSDGPPGEYEKPQGIYISLQVDTPGDARRIFEALAQGGAVTVPFEKTFWAAGGFGMLVDRFGTPWMVDCEQAAD